MRQHGNAAAAQYALYGLLRPNVCLGGAHSVDVIPDGDFLGRRIAVAYHQICDVGLPRVVHSHQVPDILFRKAEAQALTEEPEPSRDLPQAIPMPQFHDLTNRSAVRVVAVAEDVILALFVPT